MSQLLAMASRELRLAMRRTALCLLSVAVLVPTAVPAQPSQNPSPAVAIRWDPAEGGPRSAEEAWAAIEWAASERTAYEVRYFKVLKGPAPPEGFDVNGQERRRVDPPKYEVTYKIRGASTTALTLPLSQWSCPLGKTKDRKDETDLVYINNQQSREAMSRSCTIDAKAGFPPLPPDLTVQRNECSNMVVRLKRSDDPVTGADLKVEEWRLRSGHRIIEVSVSGPRNAVDVNKFKLRVVDKLTIKHAVRPLSDSKAQLGSTCKG
jgi:hypothetical protein